MILRRSFLEVHETMHTLGSRERRAHVFHAEVPTDQWEDGKRARSQVRLGRAFLAEPFDRVICRGSNGYKCRKTGPAPNDGGERVVTLEFPVRQSDISAASVPKREPLRQMREAAQFPGER